MTINDQTLNLHEQFTIFGIRLFFTDSMTYDCVLIRINIVYFI